MEVPETSALKCYTLNPKPTDTAVCSLLGVAGLIWGQTPTMVGFSTAIWLETGYLEDPPGD